MVWWTYPVQFVPHQFYRAVVDRSGVGADLVGCTGRAAFHPLAVQLERSSLWHLEGGLHQSWKTWQWVWRVQTQGAVWVWRLFVWPVFATWAVWSLHSGVCVGALGRCFVSQMEKSQLPTVLNHLLGCFPGLCLKLTPWCWADQPTAWPLLEGLLKWRCDVQADAHLTLSSLEVGKGELCLVDVPRASLEVIPRSKALLQAFTWQRDFPKFVNNPLRALNAFREFWASKPAFV